MFGVRFNYLRRYFRRVMKPMTVEEAQAKKELLSKAYFLISLATLSTVIYNVKQGRLDWIEAEGLIPDEEAKLSPAFQYARMLGVKKATVIRMKGTDVLSSKDYHKETFDPLEHVQEEENSPNAKEMKFLKF